MKYLIFRLNSGFGNFYLSNLFEQEQNYDTALRKLEKLVKNQ